MARKKTNLFDFMDEAPDPVFNLNDNEPEAKKKNLTPFDFLKTINETKNNLIIEDPDNESLYVPFIVNRGLSLFHDTLFFANEMNSSASVLTNKMQYDFYMSVIPVRKRYSKWFKKLDTENVVKYLMSDYKCNQRRAIEMLNLLSDEQKEAIVQKHETAENKKNERISIR